MDRVTKHFGEDRVVAAASVIAKSVADVGFHAPIEADASYTHERFGFIRAKVVFDKYHNRYLDADRYEFVLVVNFDKSTSQVTLASGDEGSVMQKLADAISVERRTEMLAILRDLYRGALDP